MCLLVINPIPNKELPHLIDIYPNITNEFIVSSMKERSLLSTLDSEDNRVDWTAHLMHPELIVSGYDIIYNRVGGDESSGRGTIVVRDVKDYLNQITSCPSEVINESNSPSIQWSCQLLGVVCSSRVEWDIEFSNPRLYSPGNVIRSILPYNYPRLWELTEEDPIKYLIISLIINDEHYWTKGMKNRELYLKRTPFETKLYLFMDGMAPKAFMDKFNHCLKSIRDYIEIDYVIDAISIMLVAEKLLTYEVISDKLLVNDYDCHSIKIRKFYYSKPFNYM